MAVVTALGILLPAAVVQFSDPGAEEVLYDICSMRAFTGLELGRDAIPDETTILNFRHLLERHELTKAVFAVFRNFWRPEVRCCVAAPSSTRR